MVEATIRCTMATIIKIRRVEDRSPRRMHRNPGRRRSMIPIRISSRVEVRSPRGASRYRASRIIGAPRARVGWRVPLPTHLYHIETQLTEHHVQVRADTPNDHGAIVCVTISTFAPRRCRCHEWNWEMSPGKGRRGPGDVSRFKRRATQNVSMRYHMIRCMDRGKYRHMKNRCTEELSHQVM